MCGRVRLGYVGEHLARLYAAKLLAQYEPSLDIKPTQALVVLTGAGGERILETMRWGLIPSWSKDRKIAYKTFNARAETLAEKPAFRTSFRSRRCGIVVDAFYEWCEVGGRRVPHAVRVAGAEVFTLAGLWDEWTSPEDGEIVRTCTIVTTAASERMKTLHDRMPVILAPDENLAAWLDPKSTPETLSKLLVPFAGEITIEAVTL